jgi:hypothetical protein
VAVAVRDDEVLIGRRLSVAFQRTLRIPDDSGTYPLPPGLGRLAIHRVEDFSDHVPAEWLDRPGVFIALYQREALWLAFGGAWWKPNAAQVGLGGMNAVSGEQWDVPIRAEPQNYIVCPDQPWLDGINAGHGVVRQFVATPLGAGHSVEAQLTGREARGGIQLRVFEPKPGRFPEEEPAREPMEIVAPVASPRGAAMGIGAGGRVRQQIYPDPYGVDVWDAESASDLEVHILNSEAYAAVTGRPPPPTPVSAATYTEHGLPWFDLYDEDRGDVPPPPELQEVKSVAPSPDEPPDQPVEIDDARVWRLRRRRRL